VLVAIIRKRLGLEPRIASHPGEHPSAPDSPGRFASAPPGIRAPSRASIDLRRRTPE
jgi:hypothetical protein